ncbi:MAG TPA: alanine racemase [Chthonomonadales bacterium]|nr:alanine racemase [Chthonomonadales bacterium]
MAFDLSRAWAEIDLGVLRGNVRALRDHVGPLVGIAAVVKADAYGHGLRLVARSASEAGADWLAVATPREAEEAREASPGAAIMVLSPFLPGDAGAVVRARATPLLSNIETARALSREAIEADYRLPVHIKVDTGMGRAGVDEASAPAFARALLELEGLEVDGVASQFPSADTDEGLSRNQIARLSAVRDAVSRLARRRIVAHIANSAGIRRYPEGHLDAVRPGLLLYGFSPALAAPDSPVPVEPVMTLKARVVLLRHMPAGASISYGGDCVLSRPSKVAMLGIGYGDGYPRRLSGRGAALLRGLRARILGRVCMDVTMVDATDIGGVSVGDEAVLIGRQMGERISVEEIARLVQTTEHDITTRLTSRVVRVPLDRRGLVPERPPNRGAAGDSAP